VAGFLVDRVKTSHLRFVLGASYLIQALGVSVFLFTKHISTIYVWFILYGLGNGVTLSAMICLLPRYFGRKSFGGIDGTRWLLNGPIVLLAPIYVGWAYDTTGSYTNVFTLFAILLAAAGIITCFMSPPRQRTQITKVTAVKDNS
jgi:nitrate/nitrite transporter NarK